MRVCSGRTPLCGVTYPSRTKAQVAMDEATAKHDRDPEACTQRETELAELWYLLRIKMADLQRCGEKAIRASNIGDLHEALDYVKLWNGKMPGMSFDEGVKYIAWLVAVPRNT